MKLPRSYCPQNLILEILGDKWSLLIIRDLILDNKRYFREFLQSQEAIASNILSNRLKKLESQGIVTRGTDPSHKQKVRYSLTEKGIDLLPILIENARWSVKYLNVSKEDKQRAQTLLNGGQQAIESLKIQLKQSHLVQK